MRSYKLGPTFLRKLREGEAGGDGIYGDLTLEDWPGVRASDYPLARRLDGACRAAEARVRRVCADPGGEPNVRGAFNMHRHRGGSRRRRGARRG